MNDELRMAIIRAGAVSGIAGAGLLLLGPHTLFVPNVLAWVTVPQAVGIVFGLAIGSMLLTWVVTIYYQRRVRPEAERKLRERERQDERERRGGGRP